MTCFNSYNLKHERQTDIFSVFILDFFFLGFLKLNDWELDVATFHVFAGCLLGCGLLTLICSKKSKDLHLENFSVHDADHSDFPADNCHARAEVKYEIHEKKVELSMENYTHDWFDYDVFPRGEYNASFSYHSENFKCSHLPADFRASKTSCETWMTGGKKNWFYVELDNRGVGTDHVVPVNKELEDFFFDLASVDKCIKPVYECTFEISSCKSLKKAFDGISKLSDSHELDASFRFGMDSLSDFMAKTASMTGIPEKLRNYFETGLKDDLDLLELRETFKNGNARVRSSSLLTIKNDGRDILSFSKSCDSDSINLSFL